VGIRDHPDGIRRTEPADSPAARPEFANRQVGRKLNAVITAVLVLAVALLGWRLLVLRQAGSPATTAATTPARAQASSKIPEPPAYGVASHASAFNPPVDTLVVLPFANLGDSTLSLKDALPKVREEANKALQLDPGNVDAMLALASANMSIGKNADARQGFRRVLELDPSNAVARLDYGLLLPPKPAVAETLEATRLDPDSAIGQNNLSTDYMNLGEYQKALAPSLALAKLAPHSASTAFGLAQNYALLHRDQDAIETFDLVHPDTVLEKRLVAAGKLAYQSVLDSRLRPQALASADALRKRSDLGPDSLYNLFMVYLVLDKKDVALDLLDRSCAPAPYSCGDFAINPTYIPLRGDPRFVALAKKYAPPSPSLESASSSP
jgi:hypothetical protein